MIKRSCIFFVALLILIIIVMIAQKESPSFDQWITLNILQWPFNLVVAAGLIFFFGLIVNMPGCAVPAVVLVGISGILYYQKITGNGTIIWAYMWTLIPGFFGIGFIQTGLLNGNLKLVSAGNKILFLVQYYS